MSARRTAAGVHRYRSSASEYAALFCSLVAALAGCTTWPWTLACDLAEAVEEWLSDTEAP